MEHNIPEFKLANSREVPEYMLAAIMAPIDKLSKRAAKYGLPAFRVTVSAPVVRKMENTVGESIPYNAVTITVEGDPVKIAGWRLQGRVDFEDGLTLVNARPGASLPERYRTATSFCDHCRTQRQRNSVFVFESTEEAGRYMQVGRSCLQEFMACSPEAALWASSVWGTIFDNIDGEMERSGGSVRREIVALEEVMTAAVHVIDAHGFVSKKAAEDGLNVPTSSHVHDCLFDRETRAKYKPTEASRAKGEAVVAWVLSTWGALSEPSDYQYNAVELCGQEFVRIRRIGLLVSLVTSWARENEERVAREALVNAWVGTEGLRREFTAQFLGCNSFDTGWGTMFIGRFATPEGMVVYKGNAPWWPVEVQAGDTVVFVGSIKEHDTYKEMKQTLVSRCVLGPAKKAVAKKVKVAA